MNLEIDNIKEFRKKFELKWAEKYGHYMSTFESFTLGYIIAKFDLSLDKGFDLIDAFKTINELTSSNVISKNSKNNFIEGMIRDSQKSNNVNNNIKGKISRGSTVELEEKESDDDFVSSNKRKNLKFYKAQIGINDDENEKLSMALIKKLQEEDKEIEKKIRLNHDEQNICNICITGLSEDRIFPLERCDHVFHEDCILEHLRHSVLFF